MTEPIFPKLPTNLVSPTEPIEVPIVGNRSCMLGKSASFVHHIEFDLSGTPLAGAFSPGQSIAVSPPGVDANGRPEAARLYSVSSSSQGEDGKGCVVTTTCKRVIDEFSDEIGFDKSPTKGLYLGLCSNFLCSVELGAKVSVSGPSGKKFILPENSHDFGYLFVATGTGIAPFRGMINDLFYGVGGPIQKQVHLLMGVPYTSDLLYDDFFRRVSAEHPNFHYHTVMSRELDAGGSKQGYVHDYLARTVELGESLRSQSGTLLYLCGLKGMQVGVFKYLAANDLAAPYLRIPRNLEGTDPNGWTALDVRRVRPKSHCLVEVY